MFGRNSNGSHDTKCLTGWRIAKLSYLNSAISIPQAMANYLASYRST
jgi:hypothetical protein